MLAAALPDFITFVIVAVILVGLYLAGCVLVTEFLDWLDERDLAIYDEAVLRRASMPPEAATSTPSTTDQPNNETGD